MTFFTVAKLRCIIWYIGRRSQRSCNGVNDMINGKKIIAVCVAKIGDGGSYEYIEKLHSYFAPAGYQMMIYNTCSDFFWDKTNEQGEKAVFKLIDYSITDAVVIIANSIRCKELVEQIIARAKAHGKPVFCIDGCYEGGIMVMPDYEECFRKIVKHVVEFHKIKDVGYISGLKGNPFSDDRQEVFKSVLEENGIPYEEDKVWYGDFWSNPTVEAIRSMMTAKKVPRALVCANDVMAIAACAELKENGYRVPEDVIVTGFDGVLEGRYFSPRITSCDDNYGKVAERVAELLKQSFDGMPLDTMHKVSFDVHMGQSCGCVKQGVIFYGGSEMITLNDTLNHYRVMDRMFYEISAEILTCDSLERIREVMKEIMPPFITCLINGAFLDVDNHPVMEEEASFAEEMCVLYDDSGRFLGKDNNHHESDTWNISSGELLPNMGELLGGDRPIVFNALCFRNRAIGYVCTYLPLEKYEYLSIPQCAIGISNALGGFRNTKYQSYLNSRLEDVYAHDALTGLFNRHGFYKYSEILLYGLQEKKDQKLLVISADLDGLKTINDTYGHLEGDNAIYIAAKALRESWQKEKICVRFGGDEMLCLLPVPGGEAPEITIRKRVAKFLEQYNESSGKPYEVSMSLGCGQL